MNKLERKIRELTVINEDLPKRFNLSPHQIR